VSEQPQLLDSAAPARGPLFYVGASALLIAMAVDAIAVVGRHIGIPLLGSLELVQAAIVLAASSALVSSTLARRHAAARFLLERVSPGVRAGMQHFNALLTVLFFVVLAAGQSWIVYDLRDAHEDSELLGIPFGPLRVIAVAAVCLAALIVCRQSLARPRS